MMINDDLIRKLIIEALKHHSKQEWDWGHS